MLLKSQTEEMKERFDSLYYQTIPLILFSNDKYRKKFTDLLAALFNALNTGNTLVFKEVYDSLCNEIDNKHLDKHQEQSVSIFMENYLSLNQRIRNIELTYLEFKNMVERLDNDHNSILLHGRSLNKLHKKINSIDSYLMPKKKDTTRVLEDDTTNVLEVGTTRVIEDDTTLVKKKGTTRVLEEGTARVKEVGTTRVKKEGTILGQIRMCSVCGKKLIGHGKIRGLQSFWCRPPKGCGLWYMVDLSGKIPICDKCGKFKSFTRGMYYCPICDEKPQRKGMRYKCPSCGKIGIYSGKTNHTNCRCGKTISNVKQYEMID
jgi:hypothetical protein